MHEKIYVEINGMKQGMFIQSENEDNPVLLFLHGGAGSPEIAFTDKYPTKFETMFTVCWWEQRGSCMSYNFKIKPAEMTVEQMIADTVAVTQYLCKRFKKQKVYIMGHSWGSLLGVLTIQKYPQLFHAYMGIGQVVNQDRSERLAYTYMLEQFRKTKDHKMLKKLEKYKINQGENISQAYLGIRSTGMMKLGIGVMHQMTSMKDCVAIVLKYKGYTLFEKLKFPMGSMFSLKHLWDSVLQMNLMKENTEFQIPVYIFQGKYDYQVSYDLAKEYASMLHAPIKGFYTFHESAHSPCFEEPEKMHEILRKDVLQQKVSMSDTL